MAAEQRNYQEAFNAFLGELEKFQKRLAHGLEILTSPLDISVGQTPHRVVYREDKLQLLHYPSPQEKVFETPVLVVYALVNKQYMMDLQPDRSMIKKLIESGVDLYMIDWGYPSRMDRYLTLEDYLDGYLDHCVDFVRKRTGQDKVTLLGVCQGGTFSIIYTALNQPKVKNLICVVTPVDFATEDGLLNVWAREMNIDKLVDTLGNVPGDFMNIGYLMLNPVRLMFAKYIEFIEHVDEPDFVSNFVRMEKWIFDSPDQAGETLRAFVKCFYQQNQLIRNEFVLGGRRVDLRQITVPVLNIYAQYDHLVPPASSKPLCKAVGSKDTEELCFPSGHIGIFVSSKSQTTLVPSIVKWLSTRSGKLIARRYDNSEKSTKEDESKAKTGQGKRSSIR